MAQTGVTMTVEEIPKGWSRKKLKELLSVKNGKTDTVDAVEDGQYPLFDRSVLVKKSDKYLFDCEAIIIPGEGKDFSPKYLKLLCADDRRYYPCPQKSQRNLALLSEQK